MFRRILAIVLIVLGLGTIGAGIASATVWKPDSTVTVPLPSQPSVNYVISEPGVLNIVNPTVKVRAVAQDEESPVFLAMGRTDDVEAWVAESDHGRITGLQTWEELTYQTVDGVEPEVDEDEEGAEDEGEEEPEPANPADSDMWVEEVNGVGELTYTWEDVPGRWSMIVATDGTAPAPMVELTWEREVPTPALIPGILVGSILTIIGVVLLVVDILSRRKKLEEAPADELEETDETGLQDPAHVDESQETTPEEIMAGVEAAGAKETELLTAVGDFDYSTAPEQEPDAPYPHLAEVEEKDDDRPLTRREIRERERARERAAALGLDTGDDEEQGDHWPTQEPEKEPVAAAKLESNKPRRWWQRKRAPIPPAAPGPIVIDDDTGEIVITGEIDVSSLNPQATGDSWRATWGLDQDTPTRWIPVMKSTERNERD